MTDRKKGKSNPVYQSESDINEMYQRIKQRLLNSAALNGPATIQKAKEKIARADSAIASQDAKAISFTKDAITSAMAVWDSPYVERGQRDKSDRVRGSNVRTINYKERDQFIFSVYEAIRKGHPGSSRSWHIHRLRKELAKYANIFFEESEAGSKEEILAWKLLSREKYWELKSLSAWKDKPEVDESWILKKMSLGS